MSMKQLGAVLGLVFAAVLAVVVGKQMSGDAMAVVVGVVCGVAAGIPTSVLLWVVLTRRERYRADEMERQAQRGAYPPVVVIQGGAPQGLQAGSQAGYWPPPVPGQAANRQFQVVGGDDLIVDDGRY
jgi:hypothetical protein